MNNLSTLRLGIGFVFRPSDTMNGWPDTENARRPTSLGTAFAIKHDLLVTARHVVCSPNDDVLLDRAVGFDTNRVALFDVEVCGSELAYLHLREPLPEHVELITLTDEVPETGRPWVSLGFPSNLDRIDAIGGSVRLARLAVGARDDEVTFLYCPEDKDFHGYSGAPVFIDWANRTGIGAVVKSPRDPRDADRVYGGTIHAYSLPVSGNVPTDRTDVVVELVEGLKPPTGRDFKRSSWSPGVLRAALRALRTPAAQALVDTLKPGRHNREVTP